LLSTNAIVLLQTQQVKAASLKNVAGKIVRADEVTVLSAMLDLPVNATIDYDSLLLGTPCFLFTTCRSLFPC
jgi:hypothetical protein